MQFCFLARDRFTLGQRDYTARPRYPALKPAVIYGHGAAGDATEATGMPSVPPFLQALADEGFPVVVPSMTQTWGNTVSVARVDHALDFARDELGASDDAPILFGISHGAPALLRWHQARGASRAVFIAPAIDLEYLRHDNVLGTRAFIDAAHGVAYPTALPAGVNPTQNPTSYLLPQQHWYSPSDPVSVGIEGFAAAVDAELISVGSYPHGNALVAAVPVDDVVEFIKGAG